MSICYKITPQCHSHHYLVELSFTAINPTMELALPVWIPGSYMVREFSKNITTLNATQRQQLINVEQISKNRWQLHNLEIGAPVIVGYRVYAYEFGIRTAFLDHSRGYFNPTSLCLAITGGESSAHCLEFCELPPHWQVISGLKSTGAQRFCAENYDELIDSPFELGSYSELAFELYGKKHAVILSGTIPGFDQSRFLADIEKICRYQVDLFGGIPPYQHYYFILNLSGEIYTGLEHRNSTLLMAPWYSLPNLNHSNDEDYHKLLALISHEFFHTWNVKRIKPEAFTPYQLMEENYTKLLWWFEGVTSYYDDLVLYRSGITTQEQYLKVVTDNINNVYKFSGVNNQTLANSSLTSWIKYYRQDENSPNSIVSYYVKGSLVAWGLDLLIRNQSRYSLDDVMRYLFQQWQTTAAGIGENQIPALVKAATGVDVAEFIHLATETTAMLPLVELLAQFGLDIDSRPAKNHQDNGKYLSTTITEKSGADKALDLGVKLEKQTLGYLVKNVYANTPAETAGIAGGDLIIAINNIKLTNLERQLAFYLAGAEISLTLFRQERLLNLVIQLEPSLATIYDLQLKDAQLLAHWL